MIILCLRVSVPLVGFGIGFLTLMFHEHLLEAISNVNPSIFFSIITIVALFPIVAGLLGLLAKRERADISELDRIVTVVSIIAGFQYIMGLVLTMGVISYVPFASDFVGVLVTLMGFFGGIKASNYWFHNRNKFGTVFLSFLWDFVKIIMVMIAGIVVFIVAGGI